MKRRAMAFGVDFILFSVIKLGLISAYAHFMRTFFYQMPFPLQQKVTLGVYATNFALSMTLFWGYFIFCYWMCEGKTFGKYLFELRVVSQAKEENHLTLPEIIARTFGYFAAFMSFGALFLINFVREDKQGVADFLSRTKTIPDEFMKSQEESSLVPLSAGHLKFIYPESEGPTDEDNENEWAA